MSTMVFFCEGNRVVLTAAPVVFIKPLYIIKWLQIFLLSPPPRHVYHKKKGKKKVLIGGIKIVKKRPRKLSTS